MHTISHGTALLLLASTANAQSFNIDCNAVAGRGVPSVSYGAAASRPGVWQPVSVEIGSTPLALVDLAGTSTSVFLRDDGSDPPSGFVLGNPAWTGDDRELLDDTLFFSCFPCPDPEGKLRFEGLPSGWYALYTYATSNGWITVIGAVEGPQLSGGPWPGQHALGISYALHHVNVTDGSLRFSVAAPPGGGGYNDWNGTQLVRLEPTGQPSCFGDGTGAACPCANSGLPGHGCRNSSTIRGAELEAFGIASLSTDTLGLACAFEPPGVTNILLQGDQSIAPAAFGDGLRCAGGTLKRLFVIGASPLGQVWAPANGAPSISARSAALGDPIQAGTLRVYQFYYRDADPVFCPAPQGSTFNASNAVEIVWGG